MTREERNRRAEEIVSSMTAEEKTALCSGADFWYTRAFDRVGLPQIHMADGPSGLRMQEEGAAVPGEETTCFPTSVTAGQTWNRRLLFEEGRAIGEEARERGIAVVLAPGINIKRNPLCGRNFEYYSEDPVVAGELGAAFVSGMQMQTGVGACLKHFACNSQEYDRMQSDSQIDERALREIYLRAFEKVVKKAQPAAVMCAYNRVNGTYCSDSERLLTDILRKEWGFEGAVLTDWGALNDRTAAFRAGCDLVMPGGSAYGEKEVLRALEREKKAGSDAGAGRPAGEAATRGDADTAQSAAEQGSLREPGRENAGAMSLREAVDASALRVVRLVLQHHAALEHAKGYCCDRTSHRDTARCLAEEGAVLLKNEGGILPISDPCDMVLIGAMAQDLRIQGGGSSHVRPAGVRQLRDCLPGAHYVPGCDEEGRVTEESLAQVTRAARASKRAVVVVGLTDRAESEGFDRANLSIPTGHNRMVRAALAGNPNTVAVVLGGGPMKLPWIEEVPGVLYAGLPGQEGAEAIAEILTGKVNPSGKLTETWPMEETDIPCYGFYADTEGSGACRDAQYRESIYVGYRYYEKAGVRVRFPFGYGLSYTRFEYYDLQVQDRRVSFRVCNVGNTAGSEVAQLYVGNPQDGIFRPIKELRAFEKVFLKPGEEAQAVFLLAERDFSLYQNGWHVPSGTYVIMVGSSSEDIRLSQEVGVAGEELSEPSFGRDSWYDQPAGQPPLGDWKQLMGGRLPESSLPVPGTFDMNCSMADLAPYSRFARLAVRKIEEECVRRTGGDPEDPACRMAVAGSARAPLRVLHMFEPRVSLRGLRLLLRMANRKRRGLHSGRSRAARER